MAFILGFFLRNRISASAHYRFFHRRHFIDLKTPGGLCLHDLVSLLLQFGDVRDLKRGKSLHSYFIKSGVDEDVHLRNNLVRFYGVCGNLRSAQLVFDEMREPNLVSWTAMISAYVHDLQYENGLRMFSRMFQSGFRANEFGFSVALKACRVLPEFAMGMAVHGLVVKCGFESCNFCSTSVLGLYVEYGDIAIARKIFDSMPLCGRPEASWNALLNGYVDNSNVDEAVALFSGMKLSSILPNNFTYSILVKLCANTLSFDLAVQIHGQIINAGFEAYAAVGGALVDAYAKLGLLDDASEVFDGLKQKDNLVWCALLAGFHQSGRPYEGVNYYRKFLLEGNRPDPFIYSRVFSLCSSLDSGLIGSQIHCSLIKDGFCMDSFLGSSLIDMYGSLGMVFDSYKCFLEVGQKTDVCFGSIINILLHQNYEIMALELFSEMMSVGLQPGLYTLNYAVRACSDVKALREGRSLHSYIVKNFPDTDALGTTNSLIEMYAKFEDVESLKYVFTRMKKQNEFTWTAAISGFCEIGLFEEALGLFHGMLRSPESIKPSGYTMVTVVHACSKLMALEKGRQVHCFCIKLGCDENLFVQSALITMYASFKHEIKSSFRVFSSITEPDLVSWSAIVTACAQNGHNQEALELFTEYLGSLNFLADESILSSCLSACAGLTALEIGKCLHAYIIRSGFKCHLHTASSIIDMYGKCGQIKDAKKFFDEMQNANLVCWTSMMCGYAYHGLGKEAIEVFKEMKKARVKPDGISFIGILSACSHTGLVKEGWELFQSMKCDYGLEASFNHYACMVDLLGRAEQVDEAEALIKAAPLDTKSKSLLWKTLLGACNKYGNLEAGERIGQMIVGSEPDDPSNYVMLSNVYAKAEMWDNYMELRNQMRGKHVNKQPGYSWVQVES